MNISPVLRRNLLQGIDSRSHNWFGLPTDSNFLLQNGAANVFITVPKGSTTVPIIMHHYNNSQSLVQERSLIFPLYVGCTKRCRTADSALKTLLNTPQYARLTKVITSKGDIMYGGHGLILDADFSPVFLATIEVEKPHGPASMIQVEPRVFERSNLVYKGILDRLIPLYTLGDSRIPISINPIKGFSRPRLLHYSIEDSQKVANQFLKIALSNGSPIL